MARIEVCHDECQKEVMTIERYVFRQEFTRRLHRLLNSRSGFLFGLYKFVSRDCSKSWSKWIPDLIGWTVGVCKS